MRVHVAGYVYNNDKYMTFFNQSHTASGNNSDDNLGIIFRFKELEVDSSNVRRWKDSIPLI